MEDDAPSSSRDSGGTFTVLAALDVLAIVKGLQSEFPAVTWAAL